MTDDKSHPAASNHQTTSISGPTEVREGAQVIITPGFEADYVPPPATLDPVTTVETQPSADTGSGE
ncbi:hypothetical protein [Kribbella sp. NPDC000426]|uniref:hypothetical protein n=1 Tax=Kribbella sp. NPDC000426 TaxID=3154255 RepID=UPI00332B69DC